MAAEYGHVAASTSTLGQRKIVTRIESTEMTEMKPWPKIRGIGGHGGRPLMLADLPSSNMNRWVIHRKATVVAAVRGGLVSMEQACARYSLTVDEFANWERTCARFSMPATRALATPYLVVGLGTAPDAAVRRANGHSNGVIATGTLTVNLSTKVVKVNGTRVQLTDKEYQVLKLLAQRKGYTLTKEAFMSLLYGDMDQPNRKIIDVFVCKLRKKLAVAGNGNGFIDTIWGRGYALRDEPRSNPIQVADQAS